MAKIVSVTDETVKIGQDDGSLREVRRADLNFNPSVGDEVEVYADETSITVIKVDPKPAPGGVSQAGEGVQININQDQSVGAGAAAAAAPAGGKVVNKTTYIILAFFLGGLGAHKFYSGQAGLGIVYLLFFWTCVPAVVALIEAIVALTKAADAHGNIVV
jgi:TM2 domain-containing membrane protein YozV